MAWAHAVAAVIEEAADQETFGFRPCGLMVVDLLIKLGLDGLKQILIENGGLLAFEDFAFESEKYIGDAVIAIFPVAGDDPAPAYSMLAVEFLPRLPTMLDSMFAPIRVRQIVRTLLLVGFALCPAVARAADVDLLLVLAADVSRSMDAAKFQLQRDGYAAAVADPRVLETIRAGRNGRIGLIFVEWSGIGAQRVVIDWMTLGDAASAKDFGDRLLESPRSFADRTSISGAIEFAMAQLARAPFNAPRQTIDISGDGTNNSGRNVVELRDEAVAKGITINGLVILSEIPLPWNPEHTNPPGGLDHYYRTNVIGGPSAFVMVAKNFESFGQAIISKLIAEVAQVQDPQLREPRSRHTAAR